MNLKKKKELSARVLNVGKDRIFLDSNRINEIKEAITAQDIRDLNKSGVIKIKEKKGRRVNKQTKPKKSPGKIRKKVKNRKQNYIKLTRKLRNYISELKKQGKLTKKEYVDLRKKIRAKQFKSKSHLKEVIKVK
ncbi:MAG: 50S ribosomal protein L19e [archaeon]